MSQAAGNLRVLAFSTLFPNVENPSHGVFVEHRLSHLTRVNGVAVKVVAPVPWFPSAHAAFGRYAGFAAVPKQAADRCAPVWHPRYFAVPRLTMRVAPALMAAAAAPLLRRLRRERFDFDVIDAYYLYPDGVAAALLGILFERPVVLTALGCDASFFPRWLLPRAQIRWALRRAAAITAVCGALAERVDALGVGSARAQVIRHGVDLDLFRPPVDRDAVRAAFGMLGPTLISVGHLVARKGHDIAITALTRLPGFRLLVVGSGPEEAALRRQAAVQGVADRVTFLGVMPQRRLRDLMGAADALVLCSEREGIANVLLEAMACGTPVIATPVWGTPEVVDDPAAGMLMRDRTPEAMADAARALLAAPPPRTATRRLAGRFRWEATAQQHVAVLHGAKIAAERRERFHNGGGRPR